MLKEERKKEGIHIQTRQSNTTHQRQLIVYSFLQITIKNFFGVSNSLHFTLYTEHYKLQ